MAHEELSEGEAREIGRLQFELARRGDALASKNRMIDRLVRQLSQRFELTLLLLTIIVAMRDSQKASEV